MGYVPFSPCSFFFACLWAISLALYLPLAHFCVRRLQNSMKCTFCNGKPEKNNNFEKKSVRLCDMNSRAVFRKYNKLRVFVCRRMCFFFINKRTREKKRWKKVIIYSKIYVVERRQPKWMYLSKRIRCIFCVQMSFRHTSRGQIETEKKREPTEPNQVCVFCRRLFWSFWPFQHNMQMSSYAVNRYGKKKGTKTCEIYKFNLIGPKKKKNFNNFCFKRTQQRKWLNWWLSRKAIKLSLNLKQKCKSIQSMSLYYRQLPRFHSSIP